MKTPKKSLYSRLALVTSVTLVVGYFVVYAAWTTISNVNGGDILTSTLINNMLDNLTDLNTRVSNFTFNTGNVGIGTASPGAILEVTRPAGAPVISALIARGTATAKWGAEIIHADGPYANIAGGTYAGLFMNGNVGIGTTTPTYKLSLTQGVGVITSSATVNDYYLPVTTGGAKLGVPDNVVTPLFKSGYDTVFTLHIVAKEPGTNSMLSKTYAVSILYGSPLITQIQSNSFSTTITSLNIAYDNPTRTIRATIDTTGGQSTNVYWSINGIGALTEGKFEIQ